jgi:hypothetical protein
MIVKLKVHVGLGLIAFLFTYFFSILNNTWQTSLYRAAGGFLLFFFFGIVFLMVINQMVGKSHPEKQEKSKVEIEVKLKVDHVDVVEMTDTTGFQNVSLHSLHGPGVGEKS